MTRKRAPYLLAAMLAAVGVLALSIALQSRRLEPIRESFDVLTRVVDPPAAPPPRPVLDAAAWDGRGLHQTDLLSALVGAQPNNLFAAHPDAAVVGLAPARAFVLFRAHPATPAARPDPAKKIQEPLVQPLAQALSQPPQQQQTWRIVYVRPSERWLAERAVRVAAGGPAAGRIVFDQRPSWPAALAEAYAAPAAAAAAAAAAADATLYAALLPAALSSAPRWFPPAAAGATTFYTYVETADALEKLKFYVPYAYVQSLDLAQRFPEHRAFYPVIRALAVDGVVVAKGDAARSSGRAADAAADDDDAARLLHVAAFAPVAPAVLRAARDRAMAAAAGMGLGPGAGASTTPQPLVDPASTLPPPPPSAPAAQAPPRAVRLALQTAAVQPLSFAVHPRIPDLKTLVFEGNALQGVPLRAGDAVTLGAQRDARQNETYWVLDSKTQTTLSTRPVLRVPRHVVVAVPSGGQIQNQSPTAGSVAAVDVDAPDVQPASWRPFLAVGQRVHLADLDQPAELVAWDPRAGQARFRVRPAAGTGLAAPAVGAAPGTCITDPRITQPSNCPVWDRPCVHDTDCPFFQANPKNPMRGGCHSGYCELPIGVKRLSYRKYVLGPTSFPYCHGCPGQDGAAGASADPDCCAKQQPAPDYAFPMDHFDRRREGGAAASGARGQI